MRDRLTMRRAGTSGVGRRCSSGVEQLICNQQVVGSTPTIGFSPRARRDEMAHRGEVPERPKGADCKSAGERLRRFESSPLHSDAGRMQVVTRRGSSSDGRARAFQARGRGFDSRLPLQPTCAHVAQLAEHFLGKEEVTGSNPVAGSKHLVVFEWLVRDGRFRASRVFEGRFKSGRGLQAFSSF